LTVHQSQVSIVHYDHFAIFTWLSTNIIVHNLKRGNFRTRTFKLKIQLLVLTKNIVKQFILIAQGILKLSDSQRKTLEG
jgi:aromatic ring-opening dioxygenase LigB subunit